jgi:hypothetical protein
MVDEALINCCKKAKNSDFDSDEVFLVRKFVFFTL